MLNNEKRKKKGVNQKERQLFEVFLKSGVTCCRTKLWQFLGNDLELLLEEMLVKDLYIW